MLDFISFNNVISYSFWKHIKNNTYVSWNKSFPKSKKNYLLKVYKDIVAGTYSPNPPRDYVVSNKHNAVARIVPSLSLVDYCVYYYCIANMEKYLALNRVPFTYGGFKLGGKIRNSEEIEFENITSYSVSTSPFTYNKLAWVTAWRDFQKKVYVHSSSNEFTHFLKLDIANFYNTINLTILERKIRLAVPKEYSDTVDLLFFFLKFWNKRFLQYGEQTISIPQDEVGDCSRILANFYLQDYDKYMYEICKSRDCKYMRYADDQIIMSNDPMIAEDILFSASKELFKIGLNINSAKVDRYTSVTEWSYYWCFDIFNLLGDPHDGAKLDEAANLFLALDKSKSRYYSVLNRILNCQIGLLPTDTRNKILKEAIKESYLADADSRMILKIYRVLGRNSKSAFLNKLSNMADTIIFNSFHYNILRAAKDGLPIGAQFRQKLFRRINELKL